MGRTLKLAMLGLVYLASVAYLLATALGSVQSGELRRLLLQGDANGYFLMFGLAILGVSIVAGTMAYLLAREKRD